MPRVDDLRDRLAEAELTADAETARAAREHATQTIAAAAAIPEPSKPPTEDLKKLFRDAVKQVHPDRFGGDPVAHGHAEAFMKRVNAAYHAGDAATIADLLRQWASSPHGDDGDPAALEAALLAAEERLRRAQESQIAQIMEEVLAAAASGRDRLAEMRRDAQAALAQARARLADVESAA